MDKIRDGYIRATAQVEQFEDKVGRLRWFWTCAEEGQSTYQTKDTEERGTEEVHRGGSWSVVKENMQKIGVTQKVAWDRVKWRQMLHWYFCILVLLSLLVI